MQRTRVFARARFAATIAFSAAIVVVSAFWARSYAWSDRVMGPLPRSHMFQAYTWRGTLYLVVSGPAYRLDIWETYSSPIPRVDGMPIHIPGFFGFSFVQSRGIWHVTAPLWFLALTAAGILVALWRDRIPRQFSLRTLFIAMTLFATVLGVVAILRTTSLR